MKYLINYVPRIINMSDFRTILHLLLTLMITHLIFLVLNIPINLAIFYGPVLYLYTSNKHFTSKHVQNKVIGHLSLASLVIIAEFFTTDLVKAALFFTYTLVYFLLIYSSLLQRKENEYSNVVFSYISIVSLLMLTNVFVIGTLELTAYLGYDVFSHDNYLSLASASFYIVFCIISLQELNRSIDVVNDAFVACDLTEGELQNEVCDRNQTIIDKLDQFFSNEITYLETTFSLDKLATSIGENKEQISMVLNHDMQSNFYQIVAKYRIEHARKMILTERNITIDAIMEECGFNSKSSFNKYFKQYVGSTPSTYRNTFSIA